MIFRYSSISVQVDAVQVFGFGSREIVLEINIALVGTRAAPCQE